MQNHIKYHCDFYNSVQWNFLQAAKRDFVRSRSLDWQHGCCEGADGTVWWWSRAVIKGSCRRFNEGAGDVAPHCNSSPFNGSTNPCRAGAVHTIGLPSMWRNIPATLSHTQHHQFAAHNHYEMVHLSKTLTGERMSWLLQATQSGTQPFQCCFLRTPAPHPVYNWRPGLKV